MHTKLVVVLRWPPLRGGVVGGFSRPPESHPVMMTMTVSVGAPFPTRWKSVSKGRERTNIIMITCDDCFRCYF